MKDCILCIICVGQIHSTVCRETFFSTWNVDGVFHISDSSEDRYDVLADPPSDCEDESTQQIVFEGSQQPFLPIYFLRLNKMRQCVYVARLY